MKAASPTEGITCPHGGLLPEVAGARARRIAVPPVVWEHLRANWHPLENGSRTSPKRSPSPSGSAGAAATADRRCVETFPSHSATSLLCIFMSPQGWHFLVIYYRWTCYSQQMSAST